MIHEYSDPVERFFAFARERHQIYLNRQAGQYWPWTEDPILQKYRFTNVFRELDKTTVWLRENLRDRLRNDPRVLFSITAFRWFNRIETCTALHYSGDLLVDWDPRQVKKVLKNRTTLVTGAFIVRSPDGMSKLDGIIHCIQSVWNDRDEWEEVLLPGAFHGTALNTLEALTERLTTYPMMGKFMAYEVASDMRHTVFYDNAPDIMTWANPGPGARRGIMRLDGHVAPEAKKTTQQRSEKELVLYMQGLLGKSKEEKYWPANWPQWEMREVEHTLCEFDKYERTRLGQGTPRGRYSYANYYTYLPKDWRTKNTSENTQEVAGKNLSDLSS